MFWILMAVLVLLGAALVFRRRGRYESPREEPWRSSLEPSDEPLDIEEIRRAEDEWLQEDGWRDPPEDESWR